MLWTRRSGERSLRQGVAYAAPRSGRRFAGATPTPGEWNEAVAGLDTAEPAERRTFLLREIACTSAIDVDHIIGAGKSGLSSKGGWAEHAYARYAALRKIATGRDVSTTDAHLLTRSWGAQPYISALRRSGCHAGRLAAGRIRGRVRPLAPGAAWNARPRVDCRGGHRTGTGGRGSARRPRGAAREVRAAPRLAPARAGQGTAPGRAAGDWQPATGADLGRSPRGGISDAHGLRRERTRDRARPAA